MTDQPLLPLWVIEPVARPDPVWQGRHIWRHMVVPEKSEASPGWPRKTGSGRLPQKEFLPTPEPDWQMSNYIAAANSPAPPEKCWNMPVSKRAFSKSKMKLFGALCPVMDAPDSWRLILGNTSYLVRVCFHRLPALYVLQPIKGRFCLRR